jgi:type I restriction enzyme S subunit
MSFTASIEEIVAENFNGLLSKAPHWARCRLGEIATIKGGVPLPSSGFNQAIGNPVVRIRNVLGGSTDTLFEGAVDDSWFIDHGDLLIGMDGDFNAARWKGPRALLNQRVCMVAPNGPSVTTEFLSYILPGYLSAINKHTPSITVKHLSSRTVAELPIPVPSEEEQSALVAAIETHFSRLDAAVASLTRAKANVKRARASVLKAAVEGRLVPTEAALARADGRAFEPASLLLERILAERKAAWTASGARGAYKEPVKPETAELPGLPEGWCWASVDDLAGDGGKGLCDGPFGSNLRSAHYVEAGPRVVRLQNIGDRAFRDERAHISHEHFETLRKHEIKGGDLVIASLGETLPRACIIPDWVGSALVKADCIRFSTTQMVSVPYLNSALNSPPIRKVTTEKVHGVGRPRLGLGGIRQIAVPLPPLAEQHRIDAEVDRRLSVLDALDTSLDANLARCGRLRQAVLKRAFEGRLVPAEAEAPAAAGNGGATRGARAPTQRRTL